MGDTVNEGDKICMLSGGFLVSYNGGTPIHAHYTGDDTYKVDGYNGSGWGGITIPAGTWELDSLGVDTHNYAIFNLVKQGSTESSSDVQTDTSSVAPCNHHYVWETEVEATDTTDGMQLYRCTECGDISDRQRIPAIEHYINATCMGKLKNAKAGDTVVISSDIWNTYPQRFIKALADRRDITVKLDMTYKNVKYETVITPDMEIDASGDIEYYGPLKLMQMFKFTEVK